MFSRQRKGSPLTAIVSYTLPKLHTGKNWYVDFTCYDPAEQKMKRKKYMLDGIVKVTDRRKMAADIIATVSQRLRSGWNPWAELSNSRQYANVNEVLNLYVKYLKKLHSSGSIKDSTLTDYTKRLNVLLDYMQNHTLPIMYIYQFNLSYISDFLDHLLLDRDASARTRNNYKIWLSSLCSWLVEKQYLEANPCERIKSLKEEEKKRSAISPEELKRINQYLNKEDPYFLLACRMEYYTFIRPEELTNIRLRDINLKEQKIFISSSISKNRKNGMVGLNDEIIKQMLDLKTFDNDTNDYLFSTKFKPGKKKLTTRVLRDRFKKVRIALKLPDTYVFYSLKDSGIRDLANAAGIVIARDQARHADISTTNKYLKGSSLTVHEETKHFEGSL